MLGRTGLGVAVMFSSGAALLPALIMLGRKGASQADWIILGSITAFVLALPWMIRTSVRVRPGEVRLRFWFLRPAYLDAASLEGVQVVKFNPLTDFGGWGYKLTRKHGRVFCITGDTGVRFRSGSKRYVVASKDAAGLALALAEAGAPAPESLDPVSVKELPLYDGG